MIVSPHPQSHLHKFTSLQSLAMSSESGCVNCDLRKAIIEDNFDLAVDICATPDTVTKINDADEQGQTVLHLAAVYITTASLIQLLVEQGADIDAEDVSGYTPVHLAIDVGNEAALVELLRQSANVQIAGGPRKWVPLHTAACRGNMDIVRLLLDYGAPLRPLSADRETPERIAWLMNKKEVAHFLKQWGQRLVLTYVESDFFHSNLTSGKEGERLMKVSGRIEEDGVFLVTRKRKGEGHVLVLACGGYCFKYSIKRFKEFLYIDNSPLWRSLEEMVHQYFRLDYGLPTRLRYPLKPLRCLECIPQSDIQLAREPWYSSGKFSSVRVAGWTVGGQTKLWGVSTFERGNLKSNFDEICALTETGSSPFVVTILGMFIEIDSPILVLELDDQDLCLGTLLYQLHIHPEEVGSDTDLKLWTAQIVMGMKFLEERGVVHGSLCTSSIFLKRRHDHSSAIKIGQFGPVRLSFAEQFDHFEECLDGDRCPLKWCSPEAIEANQFTHQSDIWSFGVTLWELYTLGRCPHEDIAPTELCLQLTNGLRLAPDEDTPIFIRELMAVCWQFLPSSRPTFSDILLQIKPDEYFANVIHLLN